MKNNMTKIHTTDVVLKEESPTDYSNSDYLDDWEAKEKTERKTFKGKIKYMYEDYFYYPAYRFIHKIMDIPDGLIAFYQRGKRGYADQDCWGIDWYLSDIVPKMLRTMIDRKKHGGNSYPGYSKGGKTYKEWHETGKKITQGFEAQRDLYDLDYYVIGEDAHNRK